MIATLLAAIMFLAPQLGKPTARRYAAIVEREGRRVGIDPRLIASYVKIESNWNTNAISPTNDWGLTAVHIGKHSFPKLRGMEWKLLDPEFNLRVGVRLMRTWKNHHDRTCGESPSHPWISHLKWGHRVKNVSHAEKVCRIYLELIRRFPDANAYDENCTAIEQRVAFDSRRDAPRTWPSRIPHTASWSVAHQGWPFAQPHARRAPSCFDTRSDELLDATPHHDDRPSEARALR